MRAAATCLSMSTEGVPPLPMLLQYARVAGVCLDVLVDDEIDLLKKLPSVPKHEGLKRTSVSTIKAKLKPPNV